MASPCRRPELHRPRSPSSSTISGWAGTSPRFDDRRWPTTPPSPAPEPGTRWWRTRFDLALTRGRDVSIALTIGDPNRPRSPARYRALIFVNGWMMGRFVAHVGPQRSFVLPNGVLNPHGRNTLAIAVTGDGGPGATPEPVRLVNLQTVRGGAPLRLTPPG